MTRRLRIDLDDLELALHTQHYELKHYLDLETGEVILVMDEFAGQLDGIYDEIYNEEGERVVSLETYVEGLDRPDWMKESLLEADRVRQGYGSRYILVERDDPHGDYRDMEIFIETIEHSELRDRFRRAIRGRGAFRRFKDLLLEHLDVRDAWFAFKNERNQERALRWLERCDIELIDD